jgi:hypothetical protein
MKVSDDYSKAIISRLWADFEISYCSEERMKILFVEELERYGLELAK